MDRRDMTHQWYSRFDEATMVLVVYEDDEEEFMVPAKFEVCGTCDGKGHHVNPSIDSHGLTREDFDEDPDFREAYFGGVYDEACAECHGRRVVPAVDEERCEPDLLARANEAMESYYSDQRCQAAERRMGY